MVVMRRLVATICCSLLALQTVSAGKLKGATRRSLQLTRPPAEDKGSSESKGSDSTSAPKASSSTYKGGKGDDDDYWGSVEEWTSPDGNHWTSPDGGVHASVPKEMHDEWEEKMKERERESYVYEHKARCCENGRLSVL